MEFTIIARQRDTLFLCEDAGRSKADPTLEELRQRARRIIESSGATSNRQPGDNAVTVIDTNRNDYKLYMKSSQGLLVVTAARTSYPQALVISFLSEIVRLFFEELKRQNSVTETYVYDPAKLLEKATRPYQYIGFERILQRKRVEYKDEKSHGSLRRLNESLSEVSTIMQKNVNDLILRGENLDEVSRRADNLKESSKQFARIAKRLSLSAALQTYLPFIVILLFLLAVLYFVIL